MQKYGTYETTVWKCDNGDYVLHSEAQAEIDRLQAEVERLKKINLKLSADRHVPAMRVSIEKAKSEAQATDDYMAILNERDTAHNDAIEAAAQSAISIMNGRVYFSPRARRDDQEFLDAIFALKRPT